MQTTETGQGKLKSRAGRESKRSRGSGEGKINGKRVPVPTKHRDNAQRQETKNRTGALRRLGLNAESISAMLKFPIPTITHLLEQAEGGIPAVLTAIRLNEDKDAIQFITKYDSVSASDRARVGIEEIALSSGITPKRLLEMAVSSLVEDSQSLGKIIAASYHPKVIRATAECAYLFPDNQSDRKLFLTGTGFMPQPANRTGGVFIRNEINLPPVQEVGGEMGDGDGGTFTAAEDDLQRLHSTLDGEKLLEAPKTIENASSVQIGHQYQDHAESESLSCIPVPTK